MRSFLITLKREHTDHALESNTYKWLREYLKPWKNTVSITDGTTDKRQMPLLLVEFFDEVRRPPEEFDQELVNNSEIFDYTVYSDEDEGDDDEEEDEEEEDEDDEEEDD
ncbi:MAG TPA: hypothetical protein VFA10_30235 [Ktedonobacteraceae bacterium]|nr:hypothetical protein [Ktedonobacteraceae bacterium]